MGYQRPQANLVQAEPQSRARALRPLTVVCRGGPVCPLTVCPVPPHRRVVCPAPPHRRVPQAASLIYFDRSDSETRDSRSGEG